MRIIYFCCAVVLMLGWPEAVGAAPLSVSAEVNGIGGYESGMGFIARPGDSLAINLMADMVSSGVVAGEAGQVAASSILERYEWSVDKGLLKNVTGAGATFACPAESGAARIKVHCVRSVTVRSQSGQESSDGQTADWEFVVFVEYPFDASGKGALDGYPIGIYPNENSPAAPFVVRDNLANYKPPQWFIRVAREDRAVRISPHFRIGDFCSPYTDEDVSFIALDPRLLERLENLTASLKSPSMAEPHIKIIRGFISPNEADKLKREGVDLSDFSRHKYGDAASLILDNNNDGVMDDINNDGRVDTMDVDVLAKIVEKLERETGLLGGLGLCGGPTDPLMPDTPYLSIDLRGVRQRWNLAGMAR